VRSRALIIASACLAVTLGGCSLAPSSSSSSAGYTGTKALVATTLNLLASDSSSSNGLDMCEHVLGSALRTALNKSGSCQTDVENQLKTIDDFTLTIESIKVAGKTATARVQTKVNGQKTISTVSLADEKAGWRISSISQL
jgi:copper chaperone CopZ